MALKRQISSIADNQLRFPHRLVNIFNPKPKNRRRYSKILIRDAQSSNMDNQKSICII